MLSRLELLNFEPLNVLGSGDMALCSLAMRTSNKILSLVFEFWILVI